MQESGLIYSLTINWITAIFYDKDLQSTTTFTYFKIEKSWIESARYCASKGLRLAIIRTLSQLKRIQDNIEDDVWLAGNDFSYEGHWHWASGPMNDFNTFVDAGGDVGVNLDFNWRYEPYHHDYQCMRMHESRTPSKHGKFEDYPCEREYHFVCDNGTD